jgi:hypothetical protein
MSTKNALIYKTTDLVKGPKFRHSREGGNPAFARAIVDSVVKTKIKLF